MQVGVGMLLGRVAEADFSHCYSHSQLQNLGSWPANVLHQGMCPARKSNEDILERSKCYKDHSFLQLKFTFRRQAPRGLA